MDTRWYFKEIGHEYEPLPWGSPHVVRGMIARCKFCGCLSKYTDEQRRARATKAVRVCTDRQAMLFSGIKTSRRVPLGWMLPEEWLSRRGRRS
jgi:hypothetical protein